MAPLKRVAVNYAGKAVSQLVTIIEERKATGNDLTKVTDGKTRHYLAAVLFLDDLKLLRLKHGYVDEGLIEMVVEYFKLDKETLWKKAVAFGVEKGNYPHNEKTPVIQRMVLKYKGLGDGRIPHPTLIFNLSPQIDVSKYKNMGGIAASSPSLNPEIHRTMPTFGQNDSPQTKSGRFAQQSQSSRQYNQSGRQQTNRNIIKYSLLGPTFQGLPQKNDSTPLHLDPRQGSIDVEMGNRGIVGCTRNAFDYGFGGENLHSNRPHELAGNNSPILKAAKNPKTSASKNLEDVAIEQLVNDLVELDFNNLTPSHQSPRGNSIALQMNSGGSIGSTSKAFSHRFKPEDQRRSHTYAQGFQTTTNPKAPASKIPRDAVKKNTINYLVEDFSDSGDEQENLDGEGKVILKAMTILNHQITKCEVSLEKLSQELEDKRTELVDAEKDRTAKEKEYRSIDPKNKVQEIRCRGIYQHAKLCVSMAERTVNELEKKLEKKAKAKSKVEVRVSELQLELDKLDGLQNK